jgi:hypothetical protein
MTEPGDCDGRNSPCYSISRFQNLVPVTVDTNVPFKFHRFIIGTRGKDVRKMMEDYDVSISVPPPELESDLIKVTGPPDNVRRAQEGLLQKVEELEKVEEDRVSCMEYSYIFPFIIFSSPALTKCTSRVRTAPGIPGISLKNPEMYLISKQYSANPWNVLEFNKGNI